MEMRYKRITTALLALTLLASTIVPAYAAEANEVTEPLPGIGNTKLTLEVKDDSGGTDPDNPPIDPTDIIIATVPVELPIIMNLEGKVTVPTDARIINHSTEKGIKVASVNISLSSDWKAEDFEADFTVKEQNTKEIGLSLRGDKLKTDGSLTVTDGNWNIGVDNNLPLNMQAKLPKQSNVSKTQLANIEFTIDWSGTTEGSDPSTGTEDNPTPDNPTPDESVVTVTFTTDEKGILEGNTETKINSGETVQFPTAKPSSIRYEHTGWVDTSTNSTIEPTTPITSDTTIKAIFNERAASPKNWFTTDGANTITGLSAEYLDLIDAPTDLVIPNTIGGSTIKGIGAEAFKNKDLVTSIVIPTTVTSIGKDAFYGCESLTELNLDYMSIYHIANSPFGLDDNLITWGASPSWDTYPISYTNLKKIGLDFNKSTGSIFRARGDIVDKDGILNIPSSVDGIKVISIDGGYDSDNINGYNMGGKNITQINMPDTVVKIGEKMFYNTNGINNNLVDVRLSNSLESIGANAFDGCSNVKLYIPDSVTTIGNWAFNKVNTVNLKFPKWYGAHNIILRDGVTAIPDGAFSDSSINGYLKTIILPDTIKSIGERAFHGCTGLSAIDIPDGVTSIGKLAFSGCTSLTDIVIPNGVTSIKQQTFENCSALINISIPDGVTSIEQRAFYGCRFLEIDLPNTLTTIGNEAFYSCWVQNLVVPDGVTNIGTNAFAYVPHITYNGTATGSPWGAKAIN